MKDLKNTKLEQTIFSSESNFEKESEVFLSKSNSTKEPEKRIRILIAEDSYVCQKILQSYLGIEPDLDIIGTAIDGRAAINLVKQLKPDVVLMDINMPEMDGLTATEIITNHYVDTKIIILSASDCVQDLKRALKIGATGYFLKSTNSQELTTAIRNIHKGYCQLAPGLIEKLNLDSSTVTRQQSDRTLKGQGLDNREWNVEKNNFKATDKRKFVDKLERIDVDKASPTRSNSVVVLPQRKSTKIIVLNSRLLLLLLSGILIFWLIFSGRNWMLKRSILSSLQLDRTAASQNSDSTTILPVETIQVNLVDSHKVQRTYTGTIVSRRNSSLSFERGGKLQSLTVDLGEIAKAGTSLAVLDTKSLKAKQQELLAERKQFKAQLQELVVGSRSETIAAAQSTVKSLQSQLELARTKSQRRRELYASGAISREQLDVAIAEVNTLQARMDKAQSQLNELLIGTRPEKIEAQQALLEQLDAKLASLEVELEQSILKAPFTGIIAKRFVDEGTVVSASESIFTLVEASNFEAHVGVPVDTATQIPLGSNQQLQIGSRTYQAQVLSTLPQLDSATRTLTVVLRLDESATRVVAGQVARLKLSETIANSGYWLPTTALVRGVKGLWSCSILGNPENTLDDSQKAFRVERRELEILQTQSDRVFVRGTIQDGDRVIVDGTHRFVAGQLVRPIYTNE